MHSLNISQKLIQYAKIAAWAVSALAWMLSFYSQYSLAKSNGYDQKIFGSSWLTLAIFWPLTVDLASLISMLLAYDRQKKNLPTNKAWAIAIGSGIVMIGTNILYAQPDIIPAAGTSMLMHGWPPIIALACWYVLVHEREITRPEIKEQKPIIQTTEAKSPEPRNKPAAESKPTTEKSSQNGPGRPKLKGLPETRAAMRELAAEGKDITGETLGEKLGVSPATARRYLKLIESQRPKINVA